MRDDGVDADENRVGGCCVAEEVLGDYEAAFYGNGRQPYQPDLHTSTDKLNLMRLSVEKSLLHSCFRMNEFICDSKCLA